MRLRFILLAALTAATTLPSIAGSEINVASGSKAARSTLELHVVVPRVLSLRVLDHPHAITVTAEDVARGELVVRGARLDVLANGRSGYVMRTDLSDGPFERVSVEGLERPVVARLGTTATAMPSMAGRPRAAPRAVDYVMALAPGAQPGRYPWPLSLTLQEP